MESNSSEESMARRWRLQVVSIMLPTFMGLALSLVLMLDLTELIYMTFGILPQYVVLLMFFSFGISGASAVLIYLQTGFKRTTAGDYSSSTVQTKLARLENRIQRVLEISNSNSGLSDRLGRLEKKFEEIDHLRIDAADPERIKLIDRVRESIVGVATEDFLDEIRSSLKKDRINLELRNVLGPQFESINLRLMKEIEALTRRGNVNLILGMFTAVCGITLLGYFVWNIQSSGGNTSTFIGNFIPRISLVILVEVFAYFFLRLYSGSLIEIKYFQNEITNIDLKSIALQTSVAMRTQSFVEGVISQLAMTDRNQTLKEDQSTVEIERLKAEKNTVLSVIEKMSRSMSDQSKT